MSTPENREQTSRRMPVWLRAILFIALFIFAGVAYYLNFQDVIEQLND
ncbi:MAG: hypothetical protein IIB38_14305 [Candidatus Hydrogenedentes bacterium]|nr:hypothetical protein [Candidatus Hydrogenedentota bacterium]